MSDAALRWAWSQRALAPTQRVVLMVLGEHAEGDTVTMGYAQLAYRANVSVRTVPRIARSLEDCEPPLILRERQEAPRRHADKKALQLPTRYRLYLDHHLGRAEPLNHEADITELPPAPSPAELAADPGRPAGLELAIEEAWQRLTTITPPSLRLREHEARQAFELAVDGGTSPAVIVGGWQEHLRIWVVERTEPRYIPMLVNWLKGRRWTDNLEAVRLRAAGGQSPRSDPDAEKFRQLVKER